MFCQQKFYIYSDFSKFFCSTTAIKNFVFSELLFFFFCEAKDAFFVAVQMDYAALEQQNVSSVYEFLDFFLKK